LYSKSLIVTSIKTPFAKSFTILSKVPGIKFSIAIPIEQHVPMNDTIDAQMNVGCVRKLEPLVIAHTNTNMLIN
jgi:hypothetical protein